MKNLGIEIRNKFNRKIEDSVKKEIENLKLCDVNNFCIDEDYLSLLEKKHSSIKYILGFSEESFEILDSIRCSIEKLDLENLVKICDEYEFRFFKVFDYVLGCGVIDDSNFRDVYSLFCNLIKRGTTLNSINLSLFVIGIFDKRSVYGLCRKVLHEYIDHVEVCGVICKNDYFESTNLYFNLVRDSYKDFNLELLIGINKFEKLNSRALILYFYMFNIKELNFKDLDYFGLRVLMEYMINFSKSLRRISNLFMFENRMTELKDLSDDLNFIINRVRGVVSKVPLINGNEDVEFIYLYINLFEDLNEIQVDKRLLDFLFKNLVKFIESRNFRNSVQIVKIYNKLELDIAFKLSPLFAQNYDSYEFGIYILRVFRGYKYFGSVLNEFEKSCYLTKLVGEFEFRRVLLRSLSFFYSKNSNYMAGINFLKIFMDQFEFYIEGSEYINFVAQKILERSCD